MGGDPLRQLFDATKNLLSFLQFHLKVRVHFNTVIGQTPNSQFCCKMKMCKKIILNFERLQNITEKKKVAAVLVLSQSKTMSAYEEPRSSGKQLHEYSFDPRSIH